MRKELPTLLLAPLLLVSCSCSHHDAPAVAQSAAATQAASPAAIAALHPVAGVVAPVSAADSGTAALSDQILRITLLDQHSHQPVYHAGLNLAGSTNLQWTDRQGRHEWTGGGFAATGAIDIRCPALRAETGRKLTSVPYDMKQQLTDLRATIDSSVCVEPPETTASGDYAGTFYPYYGHGAFVPCNGLPANAGFYGNAKAVWANLGDEARGQFDSLRKAASISLASDKPVHMEWTGSLTGPGAYGERGAFAYKAEIAKISVVSSDFPTDCPVRDVQ